MASAGDAYLEAFMSGFEFGLLAIRGRLAEAALDPADRKRLEAFLVDYARIVEAYHRRQPGTAAALPIEGLFRVTIDATAVN